MAETATRSRNDDIIDKSHKGPVQVYDTTSLFSPGNDSVQPLHTFPSTTTTAVRQMHANPNSEAGLSELVAILREPDGNGDSLLIEVVDVVAGKSVAGWRGGGTSETFPTSRKPPSLSLPIHSTNDG